MIPKSECVSDEDLFRHLGNECLNIRFASCRKGLVGFSHRIEAVAVARRDCQIEDRLFGFDSALTLALNRLRPKEKAVYGLFLRFCDVIPRRRGKYVALTSIVSSHASDYGLAGKIESSEIKPLWRSASAQVRSSLKKYSRALYETSDALD